MSLISVLFTSMMAIGWVILLAAFIIVPFIIVPFGLAYVGVKTMEGVLVTSFRDTREYKTLSDHLNQFLSQDDINKLFSISKDHSIAL